MFLMVFSVTTKTAYREYTVSSSKGLSCVFWLIISEAAETWSAMILSSVES